MARLEKLISITSRENEEVQGGEDGAGEKGELKGTMNLRRRGSQSVLAV